MLAAKRAGITEVILPKLNEKNVQEDLTDELRRGLTIHLVSTIDEVLLLALVRQNDQPRKSRTDRSASARRASAARRPASARGR